MKTNKKYVIGIDIGSTNTDAVLVDEGGNVLSYAKAITTSPIHQGVAVALGGVFKNVENRIDIDKTLVVRAVIGTTQCTNALLQRQGLCKVGLIRIAGHMPSILPPCFSWPENLQKSVLAGSITVNGGFECDGKEITPLDIDEINAGLDSLLTNGAESIAVSSVFASLYPEHELEVAKLLDEKFNGKVSYSLSHQIGSIGIVERENATILNSTLMKILKKSFDFSSADKLDNIINAHGINAPIFITQNNGTIMPIDEALKFPIKTISAGQTNSFIGASKLAGLDNAIIIDIGGTSSDCGMVLNGFPVKSCTMSTIAGIAMNFQMPDVISIALGGGSEIKISGDDVNICSHSVAKELFKYAKSFGGDILTLTDIGIISGSEVLNLKAKVKVDLDIEGYEKVIRIAVDKIEELVRKITVRNDLPIILVGGGAAIIDKKFFNIDVILPENFAIANAYGAALAEISHALNTIVSLNERDEILHGLREEALSHVLRRSSDSSSVRIVEQVITPFSYTPGNLAKVCITAAGKA